mmetsp:Transcript_5917/g.14168  ORF Transcript_5917/g.14168 Transcript_5917/m.14168 type:complete len:217 (-) Transcript_5917:660-1310(-)
MHKKMEKLETWTAGCVDGRRPHGLPCLPCGLVCVLVTVQLDEFAGVELRGDLFGQEAVLARLAVVIRHAHRPDDSLRVDGVWFVDHAVPGLQAPLGHDHQLIVSHLSQTDVVELCGQSDGLAEGVDLIHDLLALAGQEQRRLQSDGDFLPVDVVVCLRQLRQPVVNRMGGSQPGGFEPQSAEQCVGLDDLLQRWGDRLRLDRTLRLNAPFEQRVVA